MEDGPSPLSAAEARGIPETEMFTTDYRQIKFDEPPYKVQRSHQTAQDAGPHDAGPAEPDRLHLEPVHWTTLASQDFHQRANWGIDCSVEQEPASAASSSSGMPLTDAMPDVPEEARHLSS